MHLTETENYIIDYFKKNMQSVFTKNIRQLALLTHTSTGSIERAVKKLGYSGFSDFKYTNMHRYAVRQRLQSQHVLEKDYQIQNSISKNCPSSVSITSTFSFSGKDYAKKRDRLFVTIKQEMDKEKVKQNKLEDFKHLFAPIALETI